MSLTLHVTGDRWRQHLLSTARAHPGIVPVAKGNGYGFGIGRLARRAQWLDHQLAQDETPARVNLLAIGTYVELPEAATRFDGDLLVLTPWRPFGDALEVDPGIAPRVVHTVSRLVDVADLTNSDPDARFVLEQLTSMRRHGMNRQDLREANDLLTAQRRRGLGGRGGLEGIAMHLPLNTTSHLGEVERLINEIVASELPTRTIYVSHLRPAELARLSASYPDFTIRPRVGTDLWLGDRGALRVTSSVLDLHRVTRGEAFGYRGRGAPRDGWILIVSGGTAHGIGLEAPMGDSSLKSRASTLARGGMDAVGLVRSPFSIDGKQRLFAEPPHMQASMLFLPDGAPVPAVGDDVDVRVRFTATKFDRTQIG